MADSKRVFIGSIATETNTFSPLRTDIQDFIDSFHAAPGEHPQTPTLCSAVFPVARARAAQFGWHLIEGSATWAEPGGIINQQTWAHLRDELLGQLKAAMPVDIVLLGLHGAMIAQDCVDCEGELIAAIRDIVGPSATIGVTFDPHSHLSDKRVENADIIVVFKEFPHTDFVVAAETMVDLVHRTAIGDIKPKISVHDCRMIEIFPTNRDPMRSFVDRMKELEGQCDILSVSAIHGFMAGDTPDLGSKIIVISNDAKEEGDALARELGHDLFDMRGTTRPEFLPATEGLERALACPTGPVVIADVWDNPGGGVPGDSTIVLREMIERRIENAALGTVWDPIAVRTCFSAGAGATLPLRFGGKMSAAAGDPIDAEVTIRKLQRNAVQDFGDSIVPLGDSVWIEVAGIDVILNTVRSQVFNPNAFTNLGIDLTKKKIVVVKSTNHFHDAFAPIAAEILYVSVDGPYPNDPTTNVYKNLTRKIWPRVMNPHAEGQ